MCLALYHISLLQENTESGDKNESHAPDESSNIINEVSVM